MNVERFKDALDRHGPDLALWPLSLRWQARRLLARSEPARQAFDAARQRESQLHGALTNPPDAARMQRLQARLMAIPSEHRQFQPSQALSGTPIAPWIWRGAALSSAAAIVGFIAGISGVMAPDWTVDWAMLAYGSY